MDNFLKHIPGFRSNKTWKKVIACIYYFITFTTLFADKGMFLLFIAAPFFIFSMVDLFKAKKNNKPIKTAVTTLIISLIVTSVGFAMVEPVETDMGEKEEPTAVEEVEKEELEEVEEEPEEPKKEVFEKVRDLKIHYIDVGQGDSILVQLPNGETALIDGGPGSSSEIVLNYLQEQNVEKIDYLVATHPHEDHIGGLPTVIKNFDIGSIYMSDKTHTSKAFENLLIAIQNKGMKFKTPVAGDVLLDKEGLSLTVLAPEANINDNNLNNYSIVLKLNYKNKSFLFTGDAEAESEEVMLSNGYDFKSDVLKVGHHGSDTSTTNEFLEKVDPKYAIISCGVENKYGHPHQATIDKLAAKNIEIYRTDSGYTIIIISDGEEIAVEKKESPKQENALPKEEKQPTENIKKETSQNNSQSKQSNQNISSGNGGNSGSAGSSGAVSKPKPPANNSEPITSSYVGNSKTGKFHKASCGHAKRIANHNRVKFNSRDEAINSGYVPCKVCKP